MNILIFTVNYNADDKLFKFIRSVIIASQHCSDTHVDFHILDNSGKTQSELDDIRARLNEFDMAITLHSDGTNSGYFGGLSLSKSFVKKYTDGVVYCNPDIKLEPDFFVKLKEAADEKNSAIIAPAIISADDGFDQNPKYLSKLSLKKLKRLNFIYSNMLTFSMFTLLARVKEIFSAKQKSALANNTMAGQNIYAPHGAIFIFLDIDFYLNLPVFDCFLFGEELFIAEEARKGNITITYKPKIKVIDERHASINLLSNNTVRGYYLESIQYLLKRYY